MSLSIVVQRIVQLFYGILNHLAVPCSIATVVLASASHSEGKPTFDPIQEAQKSEGDTGIDQIDWRSLSTDDEGWIDLLAESDFASKDSLWKVAEKHYFDKHGQVSITDHVLTLEAGAKGTGVAANFSVPRVNYELTFDARRMSGSDFFCGLTFPFEQQQATLIFGGWGGKTVGISNIDRFSAIENMTSQTVDFEEGRWYTFHFKVQEESIELFIDGERLFWLDPIDRKFETWWEQRPMEPLGFASWSSTGEIRNLKLRSTVAPPKKNAAKEKSDLRIDSLLGKENLVAWCIVPFDAKKRSPAQRAAMLKELGLTRCAYDWRAEHVEEFETEILEYAKNDIQFFAFWDQHPTAFDLFQKHELQPQIWLMIPDPGEAAGAQRIEKAAAALLPTIQRAKQLGCQVGLYNHGGWAGHPDNMIAVAEELRQQGHAHVGIVWNWHHGHGFIKDWPQILERLSPYLLCLNLNGMNANEQPKILPLGQGQHELTMLQTVIDSEYDGPIGILDHRDDTDSRVALQANLDGLAQLVEKLKTDRASVSDENESSENHEAEKSEDENETDATDQAVPSLVPTEFSKPYLEALTEAAQSSGEASRGVQVFAANRFACLSCHRVDQYGGTVGPALTEIGKQRSSAEIAASILWPNHSVEPKYQMTQVLTLDGLSLRGVKQNVTEEKFDLLDPTTGKIEIVLVDDLDGEKLIGSSMPDGIAAAMTFQQQADLVRFLSTLGRDGDTFQEELRLAFSHSHPHETRPFPYQFQPLYPEFWPNHKANVNRQRIYDFYAQQANYYRGRRTVPLLLEAYPGLDGPETGHWGNQDENTWRDNRWNDVVLDSVHAAVTRLDQQVISRGINLQLDSESFVCFDIDSFNYSGLWKEKFLTFSDVRHGFMDAVRPGGAIGNIDDTTLPEGDRKYLGMYRDGPRVAFAYQIGDQTYLDSPQISDGKFQRIVAPLTEHPMRSIVEGGQPRWPEVFSTNVRLGQVGAVYEVDTIEFPDSTPWNSLFFCSGLDFLPDGSAIVATMHGDVWHVTGVCLAEDQKQSSKLANQAKWRRFAAGLHQPLGVKVVKGKIYIQCRDQLMELQDLNNDGEADYYRCVNKAFETSAAGHDYICGLQADDSGNFYTASGNQGLLKLAADGSTATVLATGFRNPDGLGLLPDGTLTVPCSEGDWTPASMVCAVNLKQTSTPHFGYRGPVNDQPPALPLFYMPRGLDNSSGGQVWADSQRWGPLQNQIVHLSFGMGRLFYAMRDAANDQKQAATVAIPGDFDSGIHRGRFNPIDGQLYVAGMTGWGSYTPRDGCLQRLRYTGKRFVTPIAFQVHQNGILIEFNQPLSAEIAGDVRSHFAQCWNYRYSGGYGSPELSAFHPGMVAHDSLTILSANLLNEDRRLFLEIPDIQPANQIHLSLQTGTTTMFPQGEVNLFVTAHQLAEDFVDYPGYRQRIKVVAAHPQLADLVSLNHSFPNPFADAKPDARAVEIATGKNLTYQQNLVEAKAGETLQLTLINTDVVPHNWVLVKEGKLSEVGDASNRLIADPAAAARQYVPETTDILAYTDIVSGGQQATIYFNAPKTPGNYPFLCTFPGHWMVMNGILKVSE